MSFDSELFAREQRRRGFTLGTPLSWLASTESTSDDALAAAKGGAPHGAVFGAEMQTRGRGRRGSSWVSTPGAGLWFSLLLRPNLPAHAVSGLSLCAGLAVQRAVAARVSGLARVKWPNDVWVDDRKISGVLIESQVSGASVSSVVVGIGINVSQHEFPDSIAGLATSLSLLSARELGREALLADVLWNLEQQIERLASGGVAAITPELRAVDALSGRRLRVDDVSGVGAGIDAAGRLLVRADDGSVTAVASGHVELADLKTA